MGAAAVPVWAMPRMRAWLAGSGPWEALARFGQLRWEPLETPVGLGRLGVEALPVAYRDESSETVALRVTGPRRSPLYRPGLDAGGPEVDALVASVDVALVDGTFWDDGELHRDMARIPHPRVRATMRHLAAAPLRERVRFVHLNHTNPPLDPDRAAARELRAAGFAVAHEGERFEL